MQERNRSIFAFPVVMASALQRIPVSQKSVINLEKRSLATMRM